MRASSVDQVILAILSREGAHLTSHQVYAEVRQRLPAVNQSTIYRSLERLANQGKVSVSDMGTGSAVFEILSDGLHNHLVCQRCGKVVTIDNTQVGEFFARLQQEHQFKINTHHLILFGLCADCQQDESQDQP